MKAISVDKVKLTPFLDMENRKSKLVQGSLIYHISFIGTYANPAILSWRGRLLLVTGNNWGRNSGMQRLLTFKWLGESGVVSDGQVSERHMHDLCISHLKHSNLSTALRGEDVRVVVQGSDRLQVFFTNSLLVHNVRMSMAQLFLNSTSGCVEVESYETIIEPLVRSSEQQKNWTPFIHLGSTYLIQFINPLTVVQPIKQMDGDRVRTVGNVVSQVGNATLHWPYGLIHGGTNALLMASGRYLSFFHSVIRRPEAHYNYTYRSHKVLVRPNLYFIGAFTFSSTLPFKLLQISRMPIMSPKLWVGPKVKKQNIETVVFPTHFFFNGSDCVISAGYQDIEGLLLRIDTSKLLNSLVDVEPY
ncbi:hypothetical protein B484DRAFT_399793 [Ochromonadaceae sp. CCMP2298]|nr:hypothetical protein B484DRAFT_399793 [Ochromonadaceae sp. CCMP2298]